MKLLNKTLTAINNPRQTIIILLYKFRIFKYVNSIVDYIFDYSNNIVTSGNVAISDLGAIDYLSQTHANRYGPARILYLWMSHGIFTKYKSYHFVDIGCGEGRACFYATKTNKRVTGIDFSPILIDKAKKNLANFTVPNQVNLTFELKDARQYLLPNEKCVVWLFSPFDDFILNEFLCINESNFRNHRSVIVYNTPNCPDTLKTWGFVKIYEQIGTHVYSLP
jgi:SAM-dependent methyltransferase